MSTLNKNKFLSVLTCKCPHCGKGKMFKFGIIKISKLTSMYDNCPECGFNYFPELGFYYGAMYLSYGINVALIAIFFFITENLIAPEKEIILVLYIIIPVLLLVPITFRLSRALMLHLFGKIK